ncbi:ribosome-binding factor A [Corallococcus sp. CA053C]|uniref:ribosome-binding factor A n=1 Tax=Corallococcus sp. CA053C TaxID=2316732 RepID=UPI000EA1FC6C|nr:ribosome-binding factor A [Corallococcus sp. CA053C]RKH00199.1 ribosome-binding factor A [Corallococcus sp. CA053C]
MSSSRSRRPRASSRRSGSSLFQSQAPSARHLRVQSTLSEEVSLLFRGELSDPVLDGLALTSFELSPEGRTARIGYTLPPDATDLTAVKEALVRAEGYLRSQLAQHLNLKRTPHLRFVHVGTAPRTEPDDSGWGSDDDGEGGDA